jgi:hypothetical protein
MLKQNPFSLYDFVGYLLPGATFLICVAWLFKFDQQFEALTTLSDQTIASIFASYITGHVLALCSAITIEKLHNFTVGYPSTYLLKLSDRVENRNFILFWFLIILLLPIGFYWLIQKCFEHYLIAKPLKSNRLISAIKRKLLKLQRSIGYRSVHNPALDEEDFFRPIYHFVLEFSPNHLPKMQNYVALYGLLRSLSFGSCGLMWAGLIMFWFGSIGVWFAGASFSAAIVFYYGFAKFYRRFSLEVLMALLVCDLRAKK